MKKFLKLTTVVVSMVMALAFVSCANGSTSNDGNENSDDGKLNLVGTYGISKVEELNKDSHQDIAITMTMPTSTSFREYCTIKSINGDTTTVQEMDVTVTKTSNGYSFNWAKYNVDGVAQGADAKAAMEATFGDDQWNHMTAEFAMTITTTSEGTWSDNGNPASEGTYTVDEANSKFIITTLVVKGNALPEPEEMEASYSDNGKTLVVVQGHSSDEYTEKTTITLTRQ